MNRSRSYLLIYLKSLVSMEPCTYHQSWIASTERYSLYMRSNMRKELCIDTFKAAAGKIPLQGAFLHSDRRSQYTSEAFRQALSDVNVQQSLSGVNHCFDNARMESFFATLKKKLLYKIPTYKMKIEQVKAIIFRYVFTYYNRVRIYTSNPDGLSPTAYRRILDKEKL